MATRKRLFISDFQGGRTLLTDPQIISRPDLGEIFSSGNIPECYESFEVKHICNEYCRFFGIQYIYRSLIIDYYTISAYRRPLTHGLCDSLGPLMYLGNFVRRIVVAKAEARWLTLTC